MRLPPPLPTVAASATYGCSLRHRRLQVLVALLPAQRRHDDRGGRLAALVLERVRARLRRHRAGRCVAVRVAGTVSTVDGNGDGHCSRESCRAVRETPGCDCVVLPPSTAAALPVYPIHPGGLAELLAQSELRHQASRLGLLSPYDHTGALLTGRSASVQGSASVQDSASVQGAAAVEGSAAVEVRGEPQAKGVQPAVHVPVHVPVHVGCVSTPHPPTLVATASADPLRDEGRAYAGVVRAAGCLARFAEQ